MSRNFFDEQESISEYDMLMNQETPREPQYSQPAHQPQAQPAAYELEEDEADIMEEAMVRLEQARLYDMLIKHDIFDGIVCNPIALQNVQEEMKAFLIGRLQVLLGIKQDEPTPERYSERSVKVELPFNKMEIQALKDIANKLTKGQSATVAEKETVEVIEEPAPQTLKPLVPKKLIQQSKPVQQQKQAAPQPKQKPQQNNVTVKNKKKSKTEEVIEQVNIDQFIGKQFGDHQLSKSDIEEAKRQLTQELDPNKKPIDQLSDEELRQRALKTKGQAVSTALQRIPMPAPGMMEGVYSNRIAQRREAANGGVDSGILDTILANTLYNK